MMLPKTSEFRAFFCGVGTIKRLHSKVFNIVNTHSSPQSEREPERISLEKRKVRRKDRDCKRDGRRRLFKLLFFLFAACANPICKFLDVLVSCRIQHEGSGFEGKWRMNAKGVAMLAVLVVGFHVG